MKIVVDYGDSVKQVNVGFNRNFKEFKSARNGTGWQKALLDPVNR